MECEFDSLGTDNLFSDLEVDHINALLDTVHRHIVDLEGHFPFHLMLLTETNHQYLLLIIPCPNTHCVAPYHLQHHRQPAHQKGIMNDQYTQVPLLIHAKPQLRTGWGGRQGDKCVTEHACK